VWPDARLPPASTPVTPFKSVLFSQLSIISIAPKDITTRMFHEQIGLLLTWMAERKSCKLTFDLRCD
jgi:hypothetical protein